MMLSQRNWSVIILVLIFFLAGCKTSGDKGADASSEDTEAVSEDISKVRPVIEGVLDADAFEKQIRTFDEAGTEYQIVDVRTPKEIEESGTIGEAIALDWRNGVFAEKMGELDKEKPVLVYCRSGGRSMEAAHYMIANGFQEVYDLDGGMMGWQEAGKAVNK